MSDQYIPMIERISEEYDESDSNMVLELADTDQGYAALKQQMSELKHQYPFIEKLLEGDGEIRLSAQEHEILSGENCSIQKRIINMGTAKPIGEIQSAFFMPAPFT